MENNNQEKKNSTKWLSLINIPIQMGAIIYLFYRLGFWLDANYKNDEICYYKVLTLVGVFLALYNVYRQVNEMGKNS
ncbi:AtpZ/AtpI family protein [Flavobacterium sp.]|jgi:ATP synthase protein I|uniref:AtpZ/AtpI family protein n=1 Tax=Flavobacterium sp. TaxID=239 RepID=UPI0038FC9297